MERIRFTFSLEPTERDNEERPDRRAMGAEELTSTPSSVSYVDLRSSVGVI